MRTNVRICMAWLALLLGTLPLLAQSGHQSSRVRQELSGSPDLVTGRHAPPSRLNRTARAAQPLPPAHSIGKTSAGARISAATVETFNYSGAIVLWTVPADVTSITIEARGAEGGNAGSDFGPGKGASITGTVAVTPGAQLKILVGQQGTNNGGGGGTFITDNANSPLVIAGGGGGSGTGYDSPNKEGQAGTSGGNGAYLGHSGGTNGNGGGQDGTNGFALASGGGLLTNGGNSTFQGYNGGQAFVNGGAGGTSLNTSTGGFGGGGAGSRIFSGGGGGGYSGGGGAGNDEEAGGVGGGGGSFNGGTNPTNTAGANSGNGLVTITYDNPCSPVDASFTGLAGPYCADAAAVTLTPATANGTFSGPGVAGTTFTPANADTGGTVTYTITVDGCPSSSTSQNVSVNPLPSVNAGKDKSVILGFGSNCTSLTATPSGGSGGNYSFTWNPGNLTGPSVNVCPQQTTTYTVTVADGNGCRATDQVTVNVQDVRCGNKNQNVQICYYGVSQCVSEKIAKNYLKLGATLGACGSANTRMSYEETSHGLLTLSLKAYPNPAVDAVTVEVVSRVAGVASFELLDVSGLARQSRRQELAEGLNQVEFRLGGLPSGLYVIRGVDALGQQATVRVSKQ